MGRFYPANVGMRAGTYLYQPFGKREAGVLFYAKQTLARQAVTLVVLVAAALAIARWPREGLETWFIPPLNMVQTRV